jgi:hypothetical protein
VNLIAARVVLVNCRWQLLDVRLEQDNEWLTQAQMAYHLDGSARSSPNTLRACFGHGNWRSRQYGGKFAHTDQDGKTLPITRWSPLLVAESEPTQKDLMIYSTLTLLEDGGE